MPKDKKPVVAAADLIANDKMLNNFLKRFKHGSFDVDTKKLKFDIMAMHRSRYDRRLKTKEVIQKYQVTFIDASVQQTAFRSRIVEMKMTCVDILSDLEEDLSILKKYLKITYAEPLKKLYTTIDGRDALIDTFLQKPIRQKKRIEATIIYADLVITDLDQAGRNFYNISETMKIAQEKRSAI